MRCLKHKRYKAKLPPRCDCVECWRMFVEKSADYQIICREIERRSGEMSIERGIDDETLIFELLMNKKKEIENDYLERKNNGSEIL